MEKIIYYFKSKTFRRTTIAVICGFILLWAILLFIYSRLLFSTIKREDVQRNEAICADISRQFDNAAAAVTSLQKTIQETTWAHKYMSGSFAAEFTAYDKLRYCQDLQRSSSGTTAVSRIALLFPKMDTAVTDVAWTNIADCTNYFWDKYDLDITPVIKDISAPTPYSGDGYPNQYYFIGEYMLLLQKLEIGASPRGYALYAISMEALFAPVATHIKDVSNNDRAALAQLTIEAYQSGLVDSTYSFPSAYFSAEEKTYSITRQSLFPSCDYVFSFRTGLSGPAIAKLNLTFAIAVILLAGGLLLIWRVSVFLYRPFDKLYKKLCTEDKEADSVSMRDITLEIDRMLLSDEKRSDITIANPWIESEVTADSECNNDIENAIENAAIAAPQPHDNQGCLDEGWNEADACPLLSHQIVAYVNEHYRDCNISLKDLSDSFNSSISAVSRSFKRATGVNFSEYLTAMRMTRAKELLRQGSSVHSVATSVGYENDYSFRRAFERSEGMRLQDFRSKL